MPSSESNNQSLRERIANLQPIVGGATLEQAIANYVDEFVGGRMEDGEKIVGQYLAAILHLVEQEANKARIAENQIYLDRINNFKPEPGQITTASFGSASGAMEVASFKRAFEDRIAKLKSEAGE